MRPRIGVLGGGQLGVMLAESLVALDADVALYDPDGAAPGRTRSDFQQARFDDPVALAALFARTDRVTFESENIPVGPLGPHFAQLRPGVEVLRVAQDRRLEKRFLMRHGLPAVPFVEVARADEVAAAFAHFGGPAVLKTALGGYDGKGQWAMREAADVPSLIELETASRHGGGFVLERRVELRAELSCIVARSADGTSEVLPVFENLHADHILDFTVLPARLPSAVTDAAVATAMQIARALGVEGLLTVEFFFAASDSADGAGIAVGGGALFVNELAPRPHNSGHVTRRATTLSQFDLFARVLCGLPLGHAALLPGGWCMGQLLGDLWPDGGDTLDLAPLCEEPRVVELYLYGKHHARPRRKMGHFIVHADSADEALAVARAARQRLRTANLASGRPWAHATNPGARSS